MQKIIIRSNPQCSAPYSRLTGHCPAYEQLLKSRSTFRGFSTVSKAHYFRQHLDGIPIYQPGYDIVCEPLPGKEKAAMLMLRAMLPDGTPIELCPTS